MNKLLDMFIQARRAQSGSGMGFLGKNRQETKPRAAALVVELTTANAGNAEAAIKAGADGLIFAWDGQDMSWLDTLKEVTDAAKASNEKTVCGLHITGGWDTLERDRLTQLHEQGIYYVILPLDAPAHLLTLNAKDVDMVVTVPMRKGDTYPILMRNLTAFDTITAVLLDFGLTSNVGEMTIEEVLHYRAVREAVRFPALLNIKGNMSEVDAYTLNTLGVQAVVRSATCSRRSTRTTKISGYRPH